MSGSGRGAERGHLMVGLMAAVAILLILSLAAEQLWKDMLRRDLEAEMIFRAQDIVRALRRYRMDNGGKLPTELKEMMEPTARGQYVLRKLWKDPLVKGGKWGLLYASPQGGYIDPNAPPGTDSNVPGPGGGAPSATKPSQPTRPKEQEEQPPDQNQQLDGGGESAPRREREEAPSRPGGSLRTSWGTGQQELTGLPIIGVKSLCTDQPFRILNDQSDYAYWRFTLLDLDAAAQRAAAGPGVPGQPGFGGKPGAGSRFGTPGQPGTVPGNRPSRLNPNN